MKTEVIFAKPKEGKEKLIAYINAKEQRVFISVVGADIAPRLGEVLI